MPNSALTFSRPGGCGLRRSSPI